MYNAIYTLKMKKVALLFFSSLAFLLVSCKKEQPKPKVIYEEPAKSVKNTAVKKDSTQIKVADLPVLMEGTKYLIHPVGDIRIYEDYNRSYGSSRTNNISYAISNYNRFEITGYFENLKFQHIDSTAMHLLTDTKVQIQTATFLSGIAEKHKKQILIYTLVDSDTNKDSKIDANDIRSLYISSISGKNFIKLSQDVQELIDWNIIETQGRLYFRTIEDINKNGAFDKNDAVHYFYVNLLEDVWEAIPYEPVS